VTRRAGRSGAGWRFILSSTVAGGNRPTGRAAGDVSYHPILTTEPTLVTAALPCEPPRAKLRRTFWPDHGEEVDLTRSGRILVVDDDPLSRRLLEKRLLQEGHDVLTAAGGTEGLTTLASTPCDIVLLDILMPDLDGFEVLEQIKADVSLRHIPVIMISGLEDLESVVRCIEMGAEDFLPKPFDPVILRARVNAGLDRVRLHELERDHVRGVFARFLPESVVDESLERSDGEPRPRW